MTQPYSPLPTLKDIFALSAELITLANAQKMTVGTAESCTGGLIGAAITAIPGSSSVFKGGIIPYANAVKIQQLNIPAEMIDNHGAVSQGVAEAMAKNARDILNVDIAVSVTGVAGPGGGSVEKPVGMVWMGLATPHGTTTQCHQFGDIGRNKVRDVTCFEALKAICNTLKSNA